MPCEQLSASSHSARSRMLYAFPLEDRVTESRGRPGGSCTFGLSWTPAISGSMTGTIIFNDGAPNSPRLLGALASVRPLVYELHRFLRSPPSAFLCPGSDRLPSFSTSCSHRAPASLPALTHIHPPVLRFSGIDRVLRHATSRVTSSAFRRPASNCFSAPIILR